MNRLSAIALVCLTLAACTTEREAKAYADLMRRAENEVILARHTGFLPAATEARLAEAKAARSAGNIKQATALTQAVLDDAVQAQVQARAAAREKAAAHR